MTEEILEDYISRIRPADEGSMEQAAARWKTVGKPLFSLGKLEDAVIQMAGIRGKADFRFEKKGLVIFCADNGVVEENVTQTGQEVTAIVAENFTKRAASVCLMAETAGVDLFPIDIGVARDIPAVTRKEYKVRYGTDNLAKGPAMTREEAVQAIGVGIRIVRELAEKGYDIIATGEMGIGNTTTSSALVSVLLDCPPAQVTGRGAGLSREGIQRKVKVIERAINLNRPQKEDVLDVISKVGGLDIAGMTGVFLGGGIYHLPVVIDGFISSAAALCAARLAPAARDYMLPSHQSGEPAGGIVLEALGLSPFLQCNMSLGEGSGAVAVMPLLDMGWKVYREMSTFEEIQVKAYEEL